LVHDEILLNTEPDRGTDVNTFPHNLAVDALLNGLLNATNPGTKLAGENTWAIQQIHDTISRCFCKKERNLTDSSTFNLANSFLN